jgi:hypothetical protein
MTNYSYHLPCSGHLPTDGLVDLSGVWENVRCICLPAGRQGVALTRLNGLIEFPARISCSVVLL